MALIFVSFAYSGWNAASYLGSEIKNPQRNLPRALIIGTLLVSLLYLVLNLLFIYLLPAEQMAGTLDVATLVAETIFGAEFARFFGWAIAFGLLSVVSAMILTGPRVYYVMAQDGLMLQHKIMPHDHRRDSSSFVPAWVATVHQHRARPDCRR